MKKRFEGMGLLALLIFLYVVIPLGALFVGFVKFMAWWRVAFGDCSL